MAGIPGLLKEKTCLVTGATSGVGLATARGLAGLGAKVIIVGRDDRKCSRVLTTMRREVPGSIAEYFVADLSSQAQVRTVAEDLKRRYSQLDVLVNNAGGYFRTREVTVDGLEMTFALNHLSYFLLTNLLLEVLVQSPSARIVNVASCAHEGGKMDFENLQGEHHYIRSRAYSQSKLANVLFTYSLAKRLLQTRVTVNALHPGYVRSNLGINNGWLKKKLLNLLDRRMISPEAGARTCVYLASSPDVEGVSGRYFDQCKEIRSSEASYDERSMEELWKLSEELTGLRTSPLP
jgi:NAD(P)-dependent dehydrogenase (short-subunit alcohol dehydrogenase family)